MLEETTPKKEDSKRYGNPSGNCILRLVPTGYFRILVKKYFSQATDII